MGRGLLCFLVISVSVASCAGYADVAYYHAFEGGANGDQNSIGRGNVVAHGHSIGPCNVWRTDTPANSIAYVIASGCELWAYSDYDTSTATCSGTNTFYSGENPSQDQSTGRAIGASKCFIICCGDSHLGRGGGNRIQDGDIYDVNLEDLLIFGAAGADQHPTATDCLVAIDQVKESPTSFTTGSPCANIASYGDCHIAFCGGGTGDNNAPQVTKSAAELSQVGNDMLLVQKFQHPCPSGDTCQGPDLDHIYNVAVDVEVKSFDFASTIYHMFAWSE